jgi:hypothetical protein
MTSEPDRCRDFPEAPLQCPPAQSLLGGVGAVNPNVLRAVACTEEASMASGNMQFGNNGVGNNAGPDQTTLTSINQVQALSISNTVNVLAGCVALRSTTHYFNQRHLPDGRIKSSDTGMEPNCRPQAHSGEPGLARTRCKRVGQSGGTGARVQPRVPVSSLTVRLSPIVSCQRSELIRTFPCQPDADLGHWSAALPALPWEHRQFRLAH